MRRRLLNFLTALSLLLCVAVCVLWVRSHYYPESWAFEGGRRYTVVSLRGTMMLEVRSHSAAPYAGPAPGPLPSPAEKALPVASPPRWDHRPLTVGQWVPAESRFGFGTAATISWTTENAGGARRYHIARSSLFAFPYWAPAVALSLLPAAWLLRALAARRRRGPGRHCAHCGYDLTGNVSGVCPECGNAVPSVA